MKMKSIHMYMLMLSIFGLGGISLLNQSLFASAVIVPPGESGPNYLNYYSFSGSGWVQQKARLTPNYNGQYYYNTYTDLERYWSVIVSDQESVCGYYISGTYRLYIEGYYTYFYWGWYTQYLKLEVFYKESTENMWSVKTSLAQ